MDHDAEAHPRAIQFLIEFEDFVTEHYGERCDDYAEGCAVCDAWQLYDEAVEMFKI